MEYPIDRLSVDEFPSLKKQYLKYLIWEQKYSTGKPDFMPGYFVAHMEMEV